MSGRKRTVDHQQLLERLLGAADSEDDVPDDDKFTKENLDFIPMDTVISQLGEDERHQNEKHGGFRAELRPGMTVDEFIDEIMPSGDGRIAPGQESTVPGIERERLLCSTNAPAHVHADIDAARNAPETSRDVMRCLTDTQTRVFCGSESYMHGEGVAGQIALAMANTTTFSVGEIVEQMHYHSMSVWRSDLTRPCRGKYVRLFFEMDDPGRFLMVYDLRCEEADALVLAEKIEELGKSLRDIDATSGSAGDILDTTAKAVKGHSDDLRRMSVCKVASHFYITCPCQ